MFHWKWELDEDSDEEKLILFHDETLPSHCKIRSMEGKMEQYLDDNCQPNGILYLPITVSNPIKKWITSIEERRTNQSANSERIYLVIKEREKFEYLGAHWLFNGDNWNKLSRGSDWLVDGTESISVW